MSGVVEGVNATCTLCGLELPRHAVPRPDLGAGKLFCCEGCATVYQVAAQAGQLEQVLASPGGRRPPLGGLLAPGETAYFALGGMWCNGCAVAAERILEHQPGVVAAEVSFCSERGRLRYDPGRTDAETALLSLQCLGYHATLLTDAADGRAERREDRILWQFFIALGFGMKVMGLYLNQLYHYYALGQYDLPTVRGLQYLVWCLATPVLLLGGFSFPRGAWRALRAGTATMDTLVTLAIYAAYAYSACMALSGRGQTYFDSVSMIVVFVTLGRYLEALGGSRARKDIRRLLRLQPARARRRASEGWEEVPARSLSAGDTILVRPGERVPADAEILEGQAALEEALLTGESLPVHKGPGDAVYAGTLVGDAALTCRVTQPPANTRLAQIASLVEQTLSGKPKIQRLADRASAYLTAGVLVAAALTALAWWVLGHGIAPALLAAVAVLVVACPCALGLATPLALTVVLGRAAQAGILVRNPAALEAAGQVQRIVFDKTGTLTRGQLAVVAVTPAPGLALNAQSLLRQAAAVEQYSEHPIARAIVAACPTPPPAATGFKAVRGLGASALVEDVSGIMNGQRQAPGIAAATARRGGSGTAPIRAAIPTGETAEDYLAAPGNSRATTRVRTGSLRFLGAEPDPDLLAEAEARTARGETVVWVGWEGTAAGLIALRDEPEPTATAALRQLAGLGIKPVMLSGDHPRTAAAIASELGLLEYEGSCSPAGKSARIQAWQKGGERVAMAGDGVNDAPALAQADISITVAGGTDVAGAVSDVVLASHNLALLPELIRLSRRTRSIIGLNLGWALAYNLVTVPLAAVGLISPAIAAATMAASSLLVVGNSLRLRAI